MKTKTKRYMPIIVPSGNTAAAILGLALCLLEARAHASTLALMFFMAWEAALIALAVSRWVQYFKQYVDEQLETRLRAASDDSATILK